MTSKVFYVFDRICNGCENCRLVCSMVLSKSSFNNKKSYISMIRADEAGYNKPGFEGSVYDEPVVGCDGDPCNGEPQCVTYCPTGALIFGTPEEIAEKKRQLTELWKTNRESRARAPWAARRA